MSDSVCRACFRLCLAEELDAELTCCGGVVSAGAQLMYTEAVRGMSRESAAALVRDFLGGVSRARVALAALRWATWREGQHDWPEGGSEEEVLLFDTIRGKA